MNSNTCHWCGVNEELLDIHTMPQLCYGCGGTLVNILTDEIHDKSGFWPNDTIQIDLAKDMLDKVEKCK